MGSPFGLEETLTAGMVRQSVEHASLGTAVGGADVTVTLGTR